MGHSVIYYAAAVWARVGGRVGPDEMVVTVGRCGFGRRPLRWGLDGCGLCAAGEMVMTSQSTGGLHEQNANAAVARRVDVARGGNGLAK